VDCLWGWQYKFLDLDITATGERLTVLPPARFTISLLVRDTIHMKENKSEKPSSKPTLEDLEQLKNLSFQPQWDTAKKPDDTNRKENRPQRSDRRSTTPKDRRPLRARNHERGEARVDSSIVRRYEPIVSFSIYPEDEPFEILTQSIRSTLRVYELFELTRLILDKYDRMAVVIHPLKKGDFLYLSVPGNQVFLSSDAALEFALQSTVEREYLREEIETDPPKGNFSSVLRCPETGRYLPPRSYHRFQALLAEHQRQHCPRKSIEQLDRSLQSTSEPEAVQEWLQSMSRKVIYRKKGTSEAENSGEEPVFDGLEGLMGHLRMQGAEKWVKAVEQVRLTGKEMAEAEDKVLRESFIAYCEWQKKFPLETSNFVRMKLRKNRFFLFKKGKKGISFVACVRRCFRPADGVFADSVSRILSVLEANEGLPVQKLPAKLFPEREDESGKVELTTEEKKSILQDLKWLKQEGYLYEYGDGSLELQPVETSAGRADRSTEEDSSSAPADDAVD